MRKFENKPFNGKIYYFIIECENTLCDSMNLVPSSQSCTPETLATPFIEEDMLNRIHSPTAEDQVNSFVSSDAESQDAGFSETLNLIDSACSNVKYQTVKDFLLRDIKTRVFNFKKH